ncbi:hypothetical protein, partial [Klebsiella pneumoniae]|uniref:hypothetical protein n=1 Tax=Klebsiella pneumoniae TaxID=573 RepID=UPI0040556853
KEILAARLERIVSHVPEQSGFRRGFDGVAANVFMLESVLRCAWKKSRSLCVGVLDVAKAFDSVSHPAIHRIRPDQFLVSTTFVSGSFWLYQLLFSI